MTIRKQIITTARSWLNTPFVHQGRIKNKGCDCLGLIIGVGQELNLKLKGKNLAELDEKNYSLNPDGNYLKSKLDNILTKKPISEAKPADIFLMQFGGNPQHLGFFSDYPNSPAMAIIHCYSQAEFVVEHRLNDFWFSKIIQVYSILD